ncbi:hypothetical protein C8R43DRAFT_219109 [Mycena crocata]|nr:hypothetical protein C8R43DRAFT_219109 [Mycena crocata]
MSRKRSRQPETWPVEVIVKAKRTSGPTNDIPNSPGFGQGWVTVCSQWGGFPSNENTWEPITSLKQCPRLVRSFWQEIGTESLLTNVAGFLVEPRKEWIDQEKAVFACMTGESAVPTENNAFSTKRSRPASGIRHHSAPNTPRTPTRNRKTKIRLPRSEPSTPQPVQAKPILTEAPNERAPDPIFSTSPLSPPLTPEPDEPILRNRVEMCELSGTSTPQESSPTLVPDDDRFRARLNDNVYLTSLQPMYSDLDTEGDAANAGTPPVSTRQDAGDWSFSDFLLDASADDILNFPIGL